MTIISTNCQGNMHDAAHFVNRMRLSRFLLQVESSGGSSTLLFRAESYPDYVHICERLGREPKGTSDWAEGRV